MSGECTPAGRDMIKQEAMKPGRVLILALSSPNHTSAFSEFQGFLLKI